MALAITSTAACGTTAKQGLLDEGMRSSTQRRQGIEAALRVMDVHPEYVGEMYSATRRHPATLDRFVERAVKDIEDPAFAKTMAAPIVDNPRSLHQALLSSVDAAAMNPEARDAIAVAVEERSAIMADIISDRPATLSATLIDSIAAVEKKAAARKALLSAMQTSAPRLAQILATDPPTLMIIAEALVKQLLKDKDAAKKLAQMIAAKVEGKSAPAPGTPR